MKLLIINPNISDDVTTLIAAEVERSKAQDTQFTICTARFGVEYIETRLESMLAGTAAAEVIAENPGFDAAMVAAFGDPGMPALKELCDAPVIGITESALAAASLLGSRISIIAISPRITAWYRDCVESYGYASRLTSIHSLSDPLNSIGSVQQEFGQKLVQLAQTAVERDGADVIVLAGAPLAGLARQVEDKIPVPVVDGISAGVKLTEAIVALHNNPHRAGSYGPPPQKARKGLSTALDEQITRRQNTIYSEREA